MASQTTISQTAAAGPVRRVMQAAAVAGPVAVLVNLCLAGVANLLASQHLVVPAGPGSSEMNPLNAGHIVGSTLVGTALGAATLVAARRWLGARAAGVWAAVAATFSLLTIATSATSDVPGSSKATLALLHVSSAAVLIPGLLGVLRRRS